MNKRNRKFAILIAVSPSCIFNEKRMLLIVTSTFSLVLDGALNCFTSILTGYVCLFSLAAAVKLLLDMGSDINAQIETNRNTALTLACFQVKTCNISQRLVILLHLQTEREEGP